ncbi:HIT domain-containing protein [Jiella sonneratiae]|uniref:HIT domain-containing protein n=1 Tax=Jiella sonneratiae TaxID=2816856 RepID=A0ABS3J7Y4_9HYPH|nr:HIT family protein [Jiella sonneratiae]MBO0904691.1 HIT domain-containing protein [Jiella sonneratiae]
MRKFKVDPRLAADSVAIGTLGLCVLLLMNDRRWPWLILVPQRNDVTEIHDLTPLDQTMLTFETCLVAKALKGHCRADKINVGALGNMVPMLHVHVIARRDGDAAWPGPVWGFGSAEPYDPPALETMRKGLAQAVLAGG